ncbi:MAG: tRNA pseudouridine(38-40) synthase TruA [Deltaproteobacteria bacterium]|nr:tRNA pseudouridine(38-40) synthase TruA [Deltaproteobacteria bacterium]
MRKIKLIIAFDGTHYHGWQRQENDPTIQQDVERAVSMICNSRITVHGAGRTDAGVHALGMTAHFKTSKSMSCSKLQKGLNSLLPGAIRVVSLADESTDFHARYSALSKTYCYATFTGTIQPPKERFYTAHYPGRISADAMRSCLEVISGTHDFSSFEAAGSRDKNLTAGRGAVRTIFCAQLNQPSTGYFNLLFTGNGFLRHMVRNLTGTIIEVGKGQRSVNEFERILKYKDRQQAGTTAPPHGLTLLSVNYDKVTGIKSFQQL